MGKIAISLPDALLEDLEEEKRASGKSRSELIRRAVEAMLSSERRKVELYIEGYRKHPEVAEEAEWAAATARTAYEASPWEQKAAP